MPIASPELDPALPPAPRWLFAKTFALCFALIAARSVLRLAHPELRAEDGTLFLVDQLDFGIRAWFVPYAGFVHLVPRICATIALLFPLRWFPAVGAFCSISLYGLASATIVRPVYSRLIQDWRIRLAAAVAFCFAPGLNEIIGDLANIHWALFFWLFLLGLRSAELPRPWEIFAALLCVFTEASSITLLPVFVASIAMSPAPKREKLRASIVPLSIVVMAIVSLLNRDARYEVHVTPSLGLLAVSIARTFTGMMLSQPLVGDGLTNLLFTIARNAFVPVGIALAVLLFRRLLARGATPERKLLALACLCALGQPLLAILGRVYAIEFYGGGFAYYFRWVYRHAYFIPTVGSLAWFTAFFACSRRPRLAYGLAALQIMLGFERIPIREHGKQHLWQENAAKLERAIAERPNPPVVIPIYPEHWVVRYPTYEPADRNRSF